MKNVLIVAKTEDVCDSISELLLDLSCDSVTTYTSGAIVRGIDVSHFETIIVSTPLSDQFGLNFVADICHNTNAGIIVLAKHDIAEEVQQKLNFTGAYVLGRPFNKSVFIQTIKFSIIAKNNIERLEQEKEQLNQQISDIKTINRAKSYLMEYLKLTEEQAHRHIQKQAMDLRKPQRAVAEDIIKTYQST